jgi:hypothetical protein
MPIYRAPTRDTRFVINEVLKLENYGNLSGFEQATPDMIDTVVEEFGKFVSAMPMARLPLPLDLRRRSTSFAKLGGARSLHQKRSADRACRMC